MRLINKIIVHCSDTYTRMDIGAEEIRRWHVEDNGWSDIGYHYVIRRDGVVEKGRPIERSGAHAAGHNTDSIGICVVGGKADNGTAESNFTYHQLSHLGFLINSLRKEYGNLELYGHRDFSTKPCPCFNVRALMGEE